MPGERIELFKGWDAAPLAEGVPLPGAYELIRRSRFRSFENLWKTGKQRMGGESEKGEIPALDSMREHGVTFIQYQTKSDSELGDLKMKRVKKRDDGERPANAVTEYCAAETLRKALASSGQMPALEPLANAADYGGNYQEEIRFCFQSVGDAEPCDAGHAEWMDHVLQHLHHARGSYTAEYARLLSHIDATVPRHVIDWKPGLFVATDNHATFHRRKDTVPGADDGTRWHMEWEGLPGIQILYKSHDPAKGLRWKFVSPFIAEGEDED